MKHFIKDRIIVFRFLLFTLVLIGTLLLLEKELGSYPTPSPSGTTPMSIPPATDREAVPQLMVAPDKRAEWERLRRTFEGEGAPRYSANYLIEEFVEVEKKKRRARDTGIEFVERGPGNYGGRSRALLVHPADPTGETWLVGAATGGIWKTSDAGKNWAYKSHTLPNLAVNTLAFSPKNPNIVYAGTGEFFAGQRDGFGLFRSQDFGESWQQIADPIRIPGFQTINEIIVDPNDANTVVLAVTSGVHAAEYQHSLFKSIDGGSTWTVLLTSDEDIFVDVTFNPSNFGTMYVGVMAKGVLKSTDGGKSWKDVSNGMRPTSRVELAVSSVDTSVVWASVVGESSGTNSDLYVSTDGGENWHLVLNESHPIDYLGTQGDYNNVVAAHPYMRNVAIVGGIDAWRVSFTEKDSLLIDYRIHQDEESLGFVMLQGSNEIGDGVRLGSVKKEETTSIEVRFGNKTQKAHRFTGEGESPHEDEVLEYRDYVEVPFQVWDVDEDRQLSISFRDHNDDGRWNLNNTDGVAEVIYVHALTYDESPTPSVVGVGGVDYRRMYSVWTSEAYGGTAGPVKGWIRIDKGEVAVKAGDVIGIQGRILANDDPSSRYVGGIHPDQHSISIITRPDERTFQLILTNDGGVTRSNFIESLDDVGLHFQYSSAGLNTTQFYSADKSPGVDRFIGGTQDNGSLITEGGVTESNSNTRYYEATGGDGVDAIWNNYDEKMILASSQGNDVVRSEDGGLSFLGVFSSNILPGPFFTRFSNSRLAPDIVYINTVEGVSRSLDFGLSWTRCKMENSEYWGVLGGHVEVSKADPQIVWAGNAVRDDTKVYLSQNFGNLFTPIELQHAYGGLISGIATHPLRSKTAYLLFSQPFVGKVMMTQDLGRTWKDITGFGPDGKSAIGFPNVAVNALFVFPNDPSRIWVATELGIVETTNDGNSWHYLETPMGPVSIYSFELQDDQLVLGTHGRGIWTVNIEGATAPRFLHPTIRQVRQVAEHEVNIEVKLFQPTDKAQVIVDGVLAKELRDEPEGIVQIRLDSRDLTKGHHILQLLDIGGQEKPYDTLVSNEMIFEVSDIVPVTTYATDFESSSPMDFIGPDFSIARADNFQSNSVHSPHPCEPDKDYIFEFERPILVQDQHYVQYRDMAILNPEESPAWIPEMYNFVALEIRSDLYDWSIPEPSASYNSNKYDDWSSAYKTNGTISHQLFKTHKFRLDEMYEVNTLVRLRFRIQTRSKVPGWGWVMDDFQIFRDEITSSKAPEQMDLVEVYPNPVQQNLFFEVPTDKRIEDVSLVDAGGRTLHFLTIKAGDAASHNINVERLKPGLYYLVIRGPSFFDVKKIMVSP